MDKILNGNYREYSKSKRRFFYLALIIILGFLVYLNSLSNGFVWDDYGQVVDNLTLRDWRNLPSILTSSTFYNGGARAGLGGIFYRPIVSLAYFLIYNIFGLDSFYFHFIQLTIHLLNLILIFFILLYLFSLKDFKNSLEIAFLATLFFAVHPANVEAVAYIGSLGEVFYTFFGLFSIITLFLGLDWQRRIIKNKFLISSFFLAFLSLLSKETGIVVFLVFFLFLSLIFKPKLNQYFKWFLGASVTVGTYLILRLVFIKIPIVGLYYFAPIARASLGNRILTIPFELFRYLQIVFFPSHLHISQHFVVSSVQDFRFWGALLVLLFVFLIILFSIHKKKITKIQIFFLLWFFLCLAPVLNIIPFDMTVAERWLYFPMIGAWALICSILIIIIKRIKKPQIRIGGYIILSILIIILGARTIIRNTNWKDNLTLFSRDIKYSKQSFDLECNYSLVLREVGRYNEAEEHAKKAIELQSQAGCGYESLAAVYALRGEGDKAVEFFSKAVKVEGRYATYINVGLMLVQLKRWQEAEDFLKKAIPKFPKNPELKWLLSLVYRQNGQIDKSRLLLEEALKDDPRGEKLVPLFELLKEGKCR